MYFFAQSRQLRDKLIHSVDSPKSVFILFSSLKLNINSLKKPKKLRKGNHTNLGIFYIVRDLIQTCKHLLGLGESFLLIQIHHLNAFMDRRQAQKQYTRLRQIDQKRSEQ